MEIDIKKNLKQIYTSGLNDGISITVFAKVMGCGSTTHLSAILDGDEMISTKAVIGLIQKLGINPSFLFTGQGDMYFSDKNLLDLLRDENQTLILNYEATLRTVNDLNERINMMEQRYAELIEITSAAIKYIKEHRDENIS
jgi:hypothetical protein